MGFSGVFNGIASGAIADAVLWVGDMQNLIIIVVGIALLGLVLLAIKRMI